MPVGELLSIAVAGISDGDLISPAAEIAETALLIAVVR